MSRASVATLLVATATAGLSVASARALSPGYGKGRGYCAHYGDSPSRYSFYGVYACATTHSYGPTPFDSAGRESFQCVELSARFLWATYLIWAGPGMGISSGGGLVAVVHGEHPSIHVGYPSPGSVPVAGDVVSLGPGGAVDGTFGHTAVVVADDQRRGYFRIMGENFPPGHAGEQRLKVDFSGRHNGRALLKGVWTRASWLILRHRPRHRHRR